MVYNKKLTHLLNRMTGYNQQTYKIMPLNTDTVSAGKIISVRLPMNALVDLSQFGFFFTISTTGTHTRLPNNLSSFIQRYEVMAGGQTICQGFNDYGTGRIIKNLIDTPFCKLKTRACMNHESVSGDTDDFGNSITSIAEGSTIKLKYYIDDLLGLFELKKVLDTGLLPEITIKFTMAQNNVLVGAGTGDHTWTMEDVHFLCTTVGVDGAYEKLMEHKIKTDKTVEIPFKQYYSISQRHVNSTRFSVSSQSVDRIFTVLRDSNYSTLGTKVDLPSAAHHKSPIKHICKYNNFESGNHALFKHQYTINNILYPQFQAERPENYYLVKQATMNEMNEIVDLNDFQKHQYVMPVTLCATRDIDSIDGFDSRNTASICEFNTVNLVSFEADGTTLKNPQPVYDSFVFIETTSSLIIGAGKALEVRL